MAPLLASSLKARYTEMPDAFFEPLRFGELEISQKFIFLPFPGDNAGQQGFKIAYRIFTKTQHLRAVETAAGMPFGKATDSDGNSYIFTHSMPVVLLAG